MLFPIFICIFSQAINKIVSKGVKMANLLEFIKNKDAKSIAGFIKVNNLTIRDGKIEPLDADSKKTCVVKYEFFDRSQIIKKILLNS